MLTHLGAQVCSHARQSAQNASLHSSLGMGSLKTGFSFCDLNITICHSQGIFQAELRHAYREKLSGKVCAQQCRSCATSAPRCEKAVPVGTPLGHRVIIICLRQSELPMGISATEAIFSSTCQADAQGAGLFGPVAHLLGQHLHFRTWGAASN